MSRPKHQRTLPRPQLPGSVREYFAPAPSEGAHRTGKMAPSKTGGKQASGRPNLPPTQCPETSSPLPSPARLSACTAPASPSQHNSEPYMPVSQTPSAGENSSAIREMLAQLPTKADLQAWATDIKNALRGEMEELRSAQNATEIKVTALQQTCDSYETRLKALEKAQRTQAANATAALLRLDDLENRNRRNNIKLRGIPEETTGQELKSTVQTILNTLLGKPITALLEMDRVHRTMGPANRSVDRPRDVLCRIHFYTVKEEIMRRAWEQGPLTIKDANVHILPDLSRLTLAMRSSLRPLLDLIKSSAATYKWGHPFHLLVKKNDRTFALHHPDQLVGLFQFLHVDTITVPNWLELASSLLCPADPKFLPQRNRRSRSRKPRRSRHPSGDHLED